MAIEPGGCFKFFLPEKDTGGTVPFSQFAVNRWKFDLDFFVCFFGMFLFVWNDA